MKRQQGEGRNSREREETAGRGKKQQGEGRDSREREETAGRGKKQQKMGEGGEVSSWDQKWEKIKQNHYIYNALTVRVKLPNKMVWEHLPWRGVVGGCQTRALAASWSGPSLVS